MSVLGLAEGILMFLLALKNDAVLYVMRNFHDLISGRMRAIKSLH